MPKHNTPPKWDVPLITQKDPNKILSRWDKRLKANKQQKINIWCVNQHIQTRIHKISKNKTHHMQNHARYKTKTCKGASNFQCKEDKYMLPQRGTLDIRYRDGNPHDLAWTKWRSLNSSCGNQVSNALQIHLLIKSWIVGPQESWVLRC
jgi:hypothetical protein